MKVAFLLSIQIIFILVCMLLIAPWSYASISTYSSFPDNASAGEKTVALTFDDGPHGTLTPRLLDALKASGTKVQHRA